jgi:hypothetical protein
MAGAGKKTFTAGEVLTASDVNTFLMEQSVMYFGGTAARASAIPTPSTGMTSYIGVTGTASIPQIETYTGSAWQTPYGLTQVANVTFTNVADIFINNVFTSAYDNYHINFTSTNASVITGLFMAFTTGGVSAGSNHAWARSTITMAGASTASSGTNFANAGMSLTDNYALTNGSPIASIDVINPSANGRLSHIVGNCIYYNTSAARFEGGAIWGILNSGSIMDGFRLFPGSGGTFSGIVKIYGYRNS